MLNTTGEAHWYDQHSHAYNRPKNLIKAAVLAHDRHHTATVPTSRLLRYQIKIRLLQTLDSTLQVLCTQYQPLHMCHGRVATCSTQHLSCPFLRQTVTTPRANCSKSTRRYTHTVFGNRFEETLAHKYKFNTNVYNVLCKFTFI